MKKPTLPIIHCVVYAALQKLDACRCKCDGLGGDVDAMNLRFVLSSTDRLSDATPSVLRQASSTLRYLSKHAGVDAVREIEALDEVADDLCPSIVPRAIRALEFAIHEAEQTGLCMFADETPAWVTSGQEWLKGSK